MNTKEGKDLMIRQGYVPPTCTLPLQMAAQFIYSEVQAGRSPCWSCQHDRDVCKGQPVKLEQDKTSNRMGGDGTPMNIAGLDLGQTNDYSALGLFTRYDKHVLPAIRPVILPPVKEGHSLDDLKPVDDFPKPPHPGMLTAILNQFRSGEAEFDEDSPTMMDVLELEVKRHYACRNLHRWQRGTSYVDIVSDVKKLDERLDNLVLVVDNTGVGRPVVDMFRRARLRCQVVPITITGGKIIRELPDSAEWHVPKVELISTIQVVLQSKRVQFIEGQKEAQTLLNELREYQVKVTAAANETYDARVGEHDDLVLAAALAIFWGERAARRLKAW